MTLLLFSTSSSSISLHSEDAAKKFRLTSFWKNWRRSAAPLLEGPSRFQFFQSVFDSRDSLRILGMATMKLSISHTEESSSSAADSLLDGARRGSPFTKFQLLSPSSETGVVTPTRVVAGVREALYRMEHPISPQVPEVDKKKMQQVTDGTAVVQNDMRLEPFADYLRERYIRGLILLVVVWGGSCLCVWWQLLYEWGSRWRRRKLDQIDHKNK